MCHCIYVILMGNVWSLLVQQGISHIILSQQRIMLSFMVCMREDQRSMRSEIQNMDVFFKENLLLFQALVTSCFHIPMQYFHMTLLAQVVACGFSGFSGLALAASAAAAEARTTGVVDDTLGI